MYSDTNFHSPSSSNPLFERKDKNRLLQNETMNIDDSLGEASLESTDDKENINIMFVHQMQRKSNILTK